MDYSNIIAQFDIEGEVEYAVPFGSGHINDTLHVHLKGEKPEDIILQRLNTSIFPDPVGLMENSVRVTQYLRGKIAEKGGDVERGTLQFIPLKNGAWCYEDPEGNCWRATYMVKNTKSYDLAENAEMFRSTGAAFGQFMADLAEYPADTLHEVIKDFHNTAKRYETFEKAVQEDVAGRVKDCGPEIEFVRQRKELAYSIVDRIADGRLPLRVTHNDTKINNILVDADTGESVCIIDLDTVMPGSCLYDYGDSIRFGATHALEDEQDLSKVDVDPELFCAYTEGYLSAVGDSLTEEEKNCLLLGAMVITFETGIRFLTDHLQGDTYFKIHRPNHNLDRCRTQFKLVKDMEDKREILETIVKESVRKYA